MSSAIATVSGAAPGMGSGITIALPRQALRPSRQVISGAGGAVAGCAISAGGIRASLCCSNSGCA